MNTVSTIKAVLLDAEDKQASGNHAVRDWLGKLEDAVYQADDLLDAFSTEALQREIMTYYKKAKQVRIFFSKSNQLAYCLTMGHKIKAIRERLDAVDTNFCPVTWHHWRRPFAHALACKTVKTRWGWPAKTPPTINSVKCLNNEREREREREKERELESWRKIRLK
jgi:hypothetical protein